MKKKSIFMFVSAILLLTACDNSSNNDNGTANYWTSNALVRLQLKGAVKTMTQNETTTEFNSDGYVVKVSNPQNGDMIYSYDAEGRLVSDGDNTMQYTNLGKYVPNYRFHINQVGLTPNLSAMIGESSRMDYKFEGDSLLMIQEYTYNEVIMRDTVKIYYADKYPTNFRTEGEFMSATYQSNGMFDVYIEGFYGTGYNSERKHTYKKDATYMLMEKSEYTDTSEYGDSSSRTDYTYNDSKDIVREAQTSGEDSYYITEYYDYVYDGQGNWTSRKNHSQNNSEVWDNEQVETRMITYFE